MKSIKILDFPFCNSNAIYRYAKIRGLPISQLSSKDIPNPSEVLILPGVGKFDQAIDFLNKNNLNPVIKNYANKASVLGICLGMQILLDSSEESPSATGLGIVKGNCRKIPACSSFRVPHVGWNSLIINESNPCLCSNHASALNSCDYYFVHSYYCDIDANCHVSSYFTHPVGKRLPASLHMGKIYGFQFHPEKSGKSGYKLLDQVFLK